MFDDEFCVFLEYQISKAFANSKDKTINRLWCDGVLPININEISKKEIIRNRKISLNAFIGNDGQDEFEVILKFGNKAVSRMSRELDLKPCVPAPEDSNFFIIDQKDKVLTIYLH